jgi:hypothetical protein
VPPRYNNSASCMSTAPVFVCVRACVRVPRLGSYRGFGVGCLWVMWHTEETREILGGKSENSKLWRRKGTEMKTARERER